MNKQLLIHFRKSLLLALLWTKYYIYRHHQGEKDQEKQSSGGNEGCESFNMPFFTVSIVHWIQMIDAPNCDPPYTQKCVPSFKVNSIIILGAGPSRYCRDEQDRKLSIGSFI